MPLSVDQLESSNLKNSSARDQAEREQQAARVPRPCIWLRWSWSFLRFEGLTVFKLVLDVGLSGETFVFVPAAMCPSIYTACVSYSMGRAQQASQHLPVQLIGYHAAG